MKCAIEGCPAVGEDRPCDDAADNAWVCEHHYVQWLRSLEISRAKAAFVDFVRRISAEELHARKAEPTPITSNGVAHV